MKVVFKIILLVILLLVPVLCIDFSLAADGFVAYRSSTASGLNYPKIRYWNSSGTGTFSSEVELPTAGSPVRWAVIKTSPLSSKTVLITSSDDGYLDSYVCYYNCTNPDEWSVTNDFAQIPVATQRIFDTAFESKTGNFIVTYSIADTNTSRDLAYMILDDNELSFNGSTEYYIDDTGAATDVVYTWVAMDANPLANSTEVVLTGFDSTNTDTNAWIWNGSSWGNQASVAESSTATTGYEALAVKYATNGTIAMVIGGNGTNGNINWLYWSGGSWSTKQTFDVDAADGNDVRWLSLKADPVSNRLQAVVVDSGSDLATAYWNGSTWATQSNIDTTVDSATRRPADFAWLPSGSSGILVWDTDTTGTTLSRRICNPTCSGATGTISTYSGTGAWITLVRNIDAADTVDVIGLRMNSTFSVGAFYYNGTGFTNYGDSTVTSTTTSSVYESYSMEFLKSYQLPIMLHYVSPTDDDDSSISRNWSYVNVSTTNPGVSCTLSWNGTNYSMSGSENSRYYNVTGLSTGNYSYYVKCNNSLISKTMATRTLRVNTSVSTPVVTLVSPTPTNNSVWEQSTMVVNVTTNKNVSSCNLNFDGNVYSMNNISGDNWNVSLYPVYDGQYVYNVSCEDFYSNIGYTETRYVTVDADLAHPDAFIAYRTYLSGSGENYPKVRFWNSSDNGTFSSEVELPDSGSPIRQVVLKISPKSSKMIVITSSNDGYLDEYVCTANCTDSNSWTVYNNFAQSIASSTQRRYDFVFESQTGNMMIVYAITSTNVSRDLAYKILDDSAVNLSESTEMYIDDTGQANDITYTWIAMDNNPTSSSSEIAMIGFDGTSSDVNAWIWNGTDWDNQAQISDAATATTGYEALAIRYALTGSGAMAIAGNFTNGNINWRYWNNTAWTSANTFDTDGADTNDVRWLSLKPDPASSDFQAVATDSGSDLTSMYYNFSDNAWTITTNIDTAVDLSTTRLVDFAWLPEGGSGILVWDTDGAGTTLSRRICSPICNSATSTISAYGGTGGWITLFRNIQATPVAKIIGIRLNSLFQTGSFYYDGTTFTNYGDANIATGDYTSAYEYYSMDFTKKDTLPVIITYTYPTYADGADVNSTSAYVNITVSPAYATCVLNWSGTTYDMEGTEENRYYNVTSLSTATYSYYVTCNTSKLSASTPIRTLKLNSTSNTVIFLISPPDNTLYYGTTVVFKYNITNQMYSVTNCSLIVNNTVINTTTSSPVSQNTELNFTNFLPIAIYNWSINCTNSIGSVSSSPTYNVSVVIPPIIDSVLLDDYILPTNSLILAAGSTRDIFCNVVASDSLGPENLVSATATFYYYMNDSDDSDEFNVHYTNSSCSINETTASNRTFACAFSVMYYANNGTWNCNVSVYNNQSAYSSDNTSTLIQPLYAVNLTDGLEFSGVAAGLPSNNILANVTNFGNMPVNITVQGYAIYVGDKVGMNCSDGTNITINRTKFSTNSTATYAQKISLNGSVQYLNLRVSKQINATPVSNATYWQIDPDPGVANRVCGGYIIFSAEAS